MTQQRTDYRQVKTFRDTYKSLEGVYDMFPKLCGLSGTEYWALAMIEEGISTQYGICHHLSISRQTINSAFRKLKKRGMIHLETMDENLRVKQVTLTEAGENFVEKEVRNMRKLEEDVWNAMTEEEKEQLTRLLFKYKTLLSEAIQHYKKEKNSSEDLQSQL